MWNDASGAKVYGEGLEYGFYYTGLVGERKTGIYPVNFQYDVLGNLTRITDPFNLFVDYSYDSLDRLNMVTVEEKIFDYEFYADGMLKAVNYPTTPGGQAIRSEYTYDNINRLETVVNKVGSNIISQYSYGYDKNGNITSVIENGATTQYAYDDLNRLEGITRPNEEISYEYDTRGNRTKRVEDNAFLSNPPSAAFGYNNWDELAQFTAGGNAYQYKFDIALSVSLMLSGIQRSNSDVNTLHYLPCTCRQLANCLDNSINIAWCCHAGVACNNGTPSMISHLSPSGHVK